MVIRGICEKEALLDHLAVLGEHIAAIPRKIYIEEIPADRQHLSADLLQM